LCFFSCFLSLNPPKKHIPVIAEQQIEIIGKLEQENNSLKEKLAQLEKSTQRPVAGK